MKPRRQKGFALLLILTILVLTGTTVFLTVASHGQRGNDRGTGPKNKAMKEAARAVIAYAVGSGASADRAPGALVCPDTSHPDDTVHASSGPGHQSPGSCGANVDVVIGRLPIRTLGLDPRSADAMEEIWYAIDRSYRDREDALPINPATSEGLTVNGTRGFAAVLILPSAPTQAQNRPSTEASDYFSPVNTGVDTSLHDADAFIDCSRVSDHDPDEPCGKGEDRTHERVIGIGIDALFDPVQRRVLQKVARALDEYRDANGGTLPRSAPLGSSEGQCAPDTFRGHLPVEPPLDEGTEPPGTPDPPGLPDEQCQEGEYLDYDFPVWVTDYDETGGNDWLRFVIYHVDCDVTAASQDEALCPQDNQGLSLNDQGAAAVLSGAGRPLVGQTRPGTEIEDYLDHPDNQLDDGEYFDFPLSRTDNDAFRGLQLQ